jgi:hypothetical protein
MLVLGSVLILALAHQPAEAGDDPIQCQCFFEEKSGYSAVGTRAICSTVTEKNRKASSASVAR